MGNTITSLLQKNWPPKNKSRPLIIWERCALNEKSEFQQKIVTTNRGSLKKIVSEIPDHAPLNHPCPTIVFLLFKI